MVPLPSQLFRFLTLITAVLRIPVSGGSTRMQLVRKTYCTTGRREIGIRGSRVPCGISDQAGTEGLPLPGMDEGVLTSREDIILTNDGMVRVTALPNRPYKYLLTANSQGYSKFEEIFGGVATVINEGIVDVNDDYEAQGNAFRHSANLTQFGFTERENAELDGAPVRVFEGFAANMPGGDVLSNFAKEGLGPDVFTIYMDEKVEGKVLKMEARNSYAGNELHQEVRVTAYGDLDGDMSIEEAVNELHDTYASSAGTVARGLAQNPFTKTAIDGQRLMPDVISGRYLPEEERLFYKAHEGRWGTLDWMKSGSRSRGLRSANVSSLFPPIKYFEIEQNSAAEEYFKSHHQPRRLVTLHFPKDCDLKKKPKDNIFCVEASINRDGSKNTIDVSGSLFDHYSPDKRIAAGFKVVQENNEAVDFHISGGGSAVVFSTDGEVHLEATANLAILDGGNPRHFSGTVEIACGYVLSGEVSLKASSTELLSATFGGVGVVGGGKNNLLGNYIPLSGGLDALVAGFIVAGKFLVQSAGGSFLRYTLDFPIAYGIWAPFYKHTGTLLVFNETEFSLLR
ncbi:hypothetical protein FOZ60_002647 [Perkinsus olseni]|uniref:Uncharacterized protein n=1 Tax=Perkinsus olseni TaxID=32597 RepID=A0A7J6NXH4_PEROL|nr:hypothetical protein FOZ60_002647 [Perkinsus olseni]